MESINRTVPVQEPERDFNYFVSCVREVTRQYDFAIANHAEDGVERDLLEGEKEALQKCQSMSEELLSDRGLPLEHRLLLYYYMGAYRSIDTRIFYLKRALETAEILETLEDNHGQDPMREILEAQLRSAENEKAARGSEAEDFSHSQVDPHLITRSSVNLPPDSITTFGGTIAPMYPGSTSESHNDIADHSIPRFSNIPPTQPGPVTRSYNDVSRNTISSFTDFAHAQPGYHNEHFSNNPNTFGASSVPMPPGSSVEHGGGTHHTSMANSATRPRITYDRNSAHTLVSPNTLEHQRRDKRYFKTSSGTRGASLTSVQHRPDHDYYKNSFGGYVAPVTPTPLMASSEDHGHDTSTESASFAHLQPGSYFDYTKNSLTCPIAPLAPTLPGLSDDNDDDDNDNDNDNDSGDAPRNHLTPITPTQPKNGHGTLESSSHNSATTAATWQPTPWVVVGELDPRIARRHLVQRVRVATARRQRENTMLEGQTEQSAEME